MQGHIQSTVSFLFLATINDTTAEEKLIKETEAEQERGCDSSEPFKVDYEITINETH